MSMLKKFVVLFVAFAVMMLGACAKKINPSELAVGITPGETYYTQFSFFMEKNTFRTTNYRRGALIPINTPVTLVAIDSKHIELKLNENGMSLTVENDQKHTNDDVQQAFKKIFAKRRVDLGAFTPEERQNILNGQVTKGMGRKAVLAALGYPPANSTPSLQSNDWTYWSSRFDRFIVRFKGDKVDAIID
jgi:hypothetical protein